MFDLVDKPRLWIPVKWPGLVAGPDDGLAVAVENVIELEVELVDAVEIATLLPPQGLTITEFFEPFKRIVSGWRKFKIAGKTPTFNDDNIRKLLAVPMFPQGFETAYLLAWRGQGEEREKNLPGSPGNGRADGPKAPEATTSSSEIVADSA